MNNIVEKLEPFRSEIKGCNYYRSASATVIPGDEVYGFHEPENPRDANAIMLV